MKRLLTRARTEAERRSCQLAARARSAYLEADRRMLFIFCCECQSIYVIYSVLLLFGVLSTELDPPGRSVGFAVCSRLGLHHHNHWDGKHA